MATDARDDLSRVKSEATHSAKVCMRGLRPNTLSQLFQASKAHIVAEYDKQVARDSDLPLTERAKVSYLR